MPAGLTFYKDLQRREEDQTSNLGEVKVIVYEDGGGNKYTLDASSVSGLSGVDDIKLSNLLKAEVKFKYHPSGGEEAETKGLGNIISTLFATKSASTANSKTILEEEVAKSSVAGAILGATESTSEGPKSILVEKLGGFLPGTDEVYGDRGSKKVARDFLAEKSSLVKTDGSNIASLTDRGKALASAILGVEYTDGENKKRSVLVEKLGKSLGDNTDTYKAKYDGSNEQIAKDFLVSKGLGSASASDVADKLITEKATELGTAILGVTKKVGNVDKPALETDLAANKTLQDAVAAVPALKTAVAADQGFRDVVTSTLASPEAIAAVPTLKTDVATQLLTDNNRAALATEIASKTELQTAVTTNTAFKNAVTSTLAKPEAIAAVPTLQNAVAANTGLQTAVKNALAGDGPFKGDVRVAVNAEEIRKVMSQPVFEIPADDNAPLSWDW